jgi:uncharacterized membrane protein
MVTLWPGDWSPTRKNVEVRFQQKGLIHMTDPTFLSERTSADGSARRRTPRLVGITVAILILIVLGFAAIRLSVDVPRLTAGTLPGDPYDARFVRHPWLTYLHIGPGVLYMVGATLQLAYWFRRRHYSVHRRLGRIVLGAGLLTGASAVVIGLLFPFGGLAEMSATVLFGAWFGVSLMLAFRAIRVDDIVRHRRWMTRAFAIGVGVGTIRIWIALFQVTGLLTFPAAFGSGVLDLVHAARFGRRTLAARPAAATGNDHPNAAPRSRTT